MSETFQKAQNAARRRTGFIIFAVLFLGTGLCYGIYWLLVARFYQVTDDAYVAGNIVEVTSRENATVIALNADNTQTVRHGQVLVEMDSSIADVAVKAAEANLARAARAVRGAFDSADSDRAMLSQARVQLAQARSDLQRRQSAKPGAVSGEEVAHARDAVNAAQAAVSAAQGNLARTLRQVEGASVSQNPDVLAAAAQLRAAVIAQSHMRIVAPVDGVIAQRRVQVGQQVSPGLPLMAVVPLDKVWVDANFKEVQLEDMRVGQPVTITTDIYGGKVTYHGRIEGVGAGSGSAFAVLPPQNASGNWIKIVQRVPVRIALDPAELKAHPLRIGLSVRASVDIRDTSGPLVTGTSAAKGMRGNIGEDTTAHADALIARILADNGVPPR